MQNEEGIWIKTLRFKKIGSRHSDRTVNQVVYCTCLKVVFFLPEIKGRGEKSDRLDGGGGGRAK